MKQINIDDYQAVIFDFDGTLVDSLGLWSDIDIEYLGRHGLEVPADLSDSINGKSFTETAEYFKERFKIADSVEKIKEDWIDLSKHHYLEDIPFKTAAREFMEYLKDKDIRLGLATSNNQAITEAFFRERGIDLIEAYAYSCDAIQGKPAPYVFLNAAKALEVDPQNCLAFEDTLEGVQAAKAAGMTVVAVYDRFARHNEEKIREIADYYINDYNELLEE